jgi:dienelactone hydrolase
MTIPSNDKTSIKAAGVMIIVALCVTAWSFAPANIWPTPTPATAGQQVVQQFDSLGNTWVYLLYLPAGYDAQPGKAWPMITFMQGLGAANEFSPFARMYDDRSPQTFTNGGPANLLRNPSNCHYISDSFIVMTPWYSYGYTGPCANNSANYTSYFRPLFRHVNGSFRVDTTRIHWMGYCYGGGLAYYYASVYPSSVASISIWSVNGNGVCIDTTKLSKLDNVPIRQYWGTADHVIPPENAMQIRDAILHRAGMRTAPFVWEAVQNGDHECWHDAAGHVTDTVKALYDWMLKLPEPTAVSNPSVAPRNKSDATARSVALGNVRVEVVTLQGKLIAQDDALIVRNTCKGVNIVRTLKQGRMVSTMIFTKQ